MRDNHCAHSFVIQTKQETIDVTPEYNIDVKQLRTAIGTYFMQALRAPDATLWGGKVGVISTLIDIWNLPKTSRYYVKHIIQSTV